MQQVPQLPVSQEDAIERPARRSACRIDERGSTSISAPVDAILTLKDGLTASWSRKRSKWTRVGFHVRGLVPNGLSSAFQVRSNTRARQGGRRLISPATSRRAAPWLLAIMHYDVFLRQRADAFGEHDVSARAHAVMQFETQSRRRHSSIIDRNGVMPIPPAIITCERSPTRARIGPAAAKRKQCRRA